MSDSSCARSAWGQVLAHAYEEPASSTGAAPESDVTGDMAMADTIIARAHEMSIPVHESRELVATLVHFDLDQQIPPALYRTVAEVLAWAYRLEHSEAPKRS